MNYVSLLNGAAKITGQKAAVRYELTMFVYLAMQIKSVMYRKDTI